MITQTIIDILKNDNQLENLLGGRHVYVTNVFKDTVDKQINVSFAYGSTSAITASDDVQPIEEGKVNVYILVKDNINNPIQTIFNIANRVLELLDLKGPFTNQYVNKIYWIRKTNADDIVHYENIGFYELAIIFEFIVQR